LVELKEILMDNSMEV
jgi:6-pyruvoyl-tetrahydropterin synthase